MENLIKLHKAQLSSDHMSCHSANHTDQMVGGSVCLLNTRVKTRHVLHYCG
jgi:hypothetical protein